MNDPDRPRRLPSLYALQVFEVAARHAHLGRAAEALHLTPGAVSRQVRQLEAACGLVLFERRNRGLFLTPAGRVLQETCRQMLAVVEAGLAAAGQADGMRPQVLSCEPTLAMRWLIPRLAGFPDGHPAARMRLLTAGGPVDFLRDGCDLALRRDDFDVPPDLHGATLAEEAMGPVMAPGVWQAAGSLAGLPCLHADSRPDAWPRWQRQTGMSPPSGRTIRFGHFYLSLQAAEAGLGVALASRYMVEEALSSGRLVAPMGFVPDGSRYCLFSARPFEGEPARMAIRDVLRAAFAEAGG